MNSDSDRFMRVLMRLDALLARERVGAELCLVVERVMALASGDQPESRGRDYATESSVIRMLLVQIRQKENLSSDWLTEAVKQYLFLKRCLLDRRNLPRFTHLTVGNRAGDYVLAMKCKGMDLSSASSRSEVEEIRFLVHYLRFQTESEVFTAIARFYPPEELPPVAQYVIEDLFGAAQLSPGDSHGPKPLLDSEGFP